MHSTCSSTDPTTESCWCESHRKARSLMITTLSDLVRLHARERPEKTAFICQGRSSTFGEFHAMTSRVANGLIAAGIANQARFAYLCRNSAYIFEMFYGGLKAGAVP